MVHTRLQQMRANPAADWTIADVRALCREYGAICEPPRGGGSHYKVYHHENPGILTIPSKRPIKPIYIRKLVSYLSAIGRTND